MTKKKCDKCFQSHYLFKLFRTIVGSLENSPPLPSVSSSGATELLGNQQFSKFVNVIKMFKMLDNICSPLSNTISGPRFYPS